MAATGFVTRTPIESRQPVARRRAAIFLFRDAGVGADENLPDCSGAADAGDQLVDGARRALGTNSKLHAQFTRRRWSELGSNGETRRHRLPEHVGGHARQL